MKLYKVEVGKNILKYEYISDGIKTSLINKYTHNLYHYHLSYTCIKYFGGTVLYLDYDKITTYLIDLESKIDRNNISETAFPIIDEIRSIKDSIIRDIKLSKIIG